MTGAGPAVPFKYSIRERLDSIGNPASSRYPFSVRHVYQRNGTVDTAEFYSGGSPATYKRYRYAFGSAAYDALNRLKSADYSYYNAGWQSTLAYDLAGIGYDRNGNLTGLQRYRETATLVDNLTKTIATGSNRLTSVSDAVGSTGESWDAESGSLTYDANGNLLTAPLPYGLTAASYDYQNLPLSLTSNTVTDTYRYNEAGQRIAKQVGIGNREMYVLDGATQLSVVTVNSSGSALSWYWNVVAGDKVVGRQPSSGDRRFYHTDLLGSTRAVTDSTVILESYDYEPWGVLMPGRTLGSGTKEGFTGKERDPETGLDYFGGRYVMSALARWAVVDAVADSTPEWTPYNYAGNNPMASADPDGRETIVLEGDEAKALFTALGFGRRGRHWVLGTQFVEVPGGAMDDPAAEYRVGDYTLRLARPEVVLADRIVGFRHWRYTAYGLQAIAMIAAFGDAVDHRWLENRLRREHALATYRALRDLHASGAAVNEEVLQAVLRRSEEEAT